MNNEFTWFNVTIYVIFVRCTFQTKVNGTQCCHEETVLVHTIRIEVDEPIQGWIARIWVDSMIFFVEAMHQTLNETKQN